MPRGLLARRVPARPALLDWAVTFSKAVRRRIRVRDQEYFWVASGNDGYIDLRAMAVEGGQLLACTFGYHHREIP